MNAQQVLVPDSLLLDQTLQESAKLLWVLLQVVPSATGQLAAKSGLARQTIRKGLAQLEATGWYPTRPAEATARAHLPIDLLFDDSLRCQAKLLYALLQLIPGLEGSAGSFRYPGLSNLTGWSPNALKRAAGELQAAGWVRLTQGSRVRPIKFTLRNPVANHREIAVIEAAEHLKECDFAPEEFMKLYLDLIVDSREWVNNAKPGFLVNYFTGQRMEFDRYYPPKVAFEYNGEQHYRTTTRYPKTAKVMNQRGRDLLKLGICVTEGITLVTVHVWDLTLEGMKAKVGDLLPLRSLENDGPLIDYLESVTPARKWKGRRHQQSC